MLTRPADLLPSRPKPSVPQGIDLLIQPAVEGAFVRDAHLLALLDRALVQDPTFSGDEAVRELHTAVHAAIDAITGPEPPVSSAEGGDGLGKELSRLPAVLRHSNDRNIGKLIRQLPPPVLETLESVLWDNEVAQVVSGNIKVERKLDELLRELATSPTGTAQQPDRSRSCYRRPSCIWSAATTSVHS